MNLAGRTDLEKAAEARDYVVTWAPNAVPAASTTFVLDAATAALPAGYHLHKDTTGLRLHNKKGLTISIR